MADTLIFTEDAVTREITLTEQAPVQVESTTETLEVESVQSQAFEVTVQGGEVINVAVTGDVGTVARLAAAVVLAETNASQSALEASLSETAAANSAAAALASELAAAASESAAATSAGQANTNRIAAQSAATAAAGSESLAANHVDSASNSATAAAASQTAAGNSATSASNSAAAASGSAAAAAASESAAAISEDDALAHSITASQWAEHPEDTQIPGVLGARSALHHAIKAENSNIAAASSASAASGSASAASASATSASSSAAAAAVSEGNASNSAADAANSVLTASGHEQAAESSADAALASEQAAQSSASAASSSATAAGNSATSADNSATAASGSATSAANSATSASGSASAASTARSGAETARAGAESAESNAAASELAAGASELAAAASESNAAASELLASQWASHPHEVLVPGQTEYSGKHYAIEAAASAASASGQVVFLGSWDAAANGTPPTPANSARYIVISDGVVDGKNVYTNDFITYSVPDAEWYVTPGSGNVSSVNGYTGAVELDYGDFAGATNIVLGNAVQIRGGKASGGDLSIAYTSGDSQINFGSTAATSWIHSNTSPVWWDGSTQKQLIHDGAGSVQQQIQQKLSAWTRTAYGYIGLGGPASSSASDYDAVNLKVRDAAGTGVATVYVDEDLVSGGFALRKHNSGAGFSNFFNVASDGTITTPLGTAIHSGGGQSIAGNLTVDDILTAQRVVLTDSAQQLEFNHPTDNGSAHYGFEDDYLRIRFGGTSLIKGLRLDNYDTPVVELKRDSASNFVYGLQENGTNLSAKYLGINAVAADSARLGDVEASRFIFGEGAMGTSSISAGEHLDPDDGVTDIGWDGIRKSGFYDGIDRPGAPGTGWYWGIHASHANGNGYGWTMVSSNSSEPSWYLRGLAGNTNGAWHRVLHEDINATTTGSWTFEQNINFPVGKGVTSKDTNGISYEILAIGEASNKVDVGDPALQISLHSNLAPGWYNGTTTVPLLHAAGGQSVAGLNITGTSGLKLYQDGGDHLYMSFYADSDNPTTRSAFIGYPSTGTSELSVYNEMADGHLNLITQGAGEVRANGGRVITAPNDQVELKANYLIFQDAGATNRDYIAYNDTTNAFYFNADTSLGNASANASVYMGQALVNNTAQRMSFGGGGDYGIADYRVHDDGTDNVPTLYVDQNLFTNDTLWKIRRHTGATAFTNLVEVKKSGDIVLNGTDTVLHSGGGVISGEQFAESPVWFDSPDQRNVGTFGKRLDVASYLAAGEWMEIARLTPSGNSRNYWLSGELFYGASADSSCIRFIWSVRSNTMPSTSVRLDSWRISENQSGVRLAIWKDDTTGESRLMVKKESGGDIHNLSCSLDIHQRGNYQDYDFSQRGEFTAIEAGFTETVYTPREYLITAGGQTIAGDLSLTTLKPSTSIVPQNNDFKYYLRQAGGGNAQIVWLDGSDNFYAGNTTLPTFVNSSEIPKWRSGSGVFELLHDGGNQTIGDTTTISNAGYVNLLQLTRDSATPQTWVFKVSTDGTMDIERTAGSGTARIDVPALAASGSVTGSNLNVSDWDAAYSWGDHASAGYAAGNHNHDGTYAPASHTHSYLPLSGGFMSGDLVLHSTGGTSRFTNGSGDGASYTTHNFRIKGWYGMGMEDNDGGVHGYYNFRTGAWDVKGGFYVDGQEVYHKGNVGSIGESVKIVSTDTANWWGTSSESKLTINQTNAGHDAVMTFHVSGDFATHFGLNGATNTIGVGGWSGGSEFRPLACFAIANGHEGFTLSDGSDPGWIRSSGSGFLPVVSSSTGSGNSSLGTSGWRWSAVYANNAYFTTDWEITSDINVKENLRALEPRESAAKLNRLGAAQRYDRTDTGNKDELGTIAQWCQDAGMGELVSRNEETGQLSVKYRGLQMYQLSARLDDVRRISELEAKIERLERLLGAA